MEIRIVVLAKALFAALFNPALKDGAITEYSIASMVYVKPNVRILAP
jgi:hypothetical protein